MDVLNLIASDIIAGLTATAGAWMDNPYVGGLALVIIVLSALFMSELGQVVSTAFTAIVVWGLGLIVLGAYRAEPQWDFMSQLESSWAALAGTATEPGLTFFQFFIYLLIFTVLIGLINLIKGLISG